VDISGLKVALIFDDSLDRVGDVGQYVRALARGLREFGAEPTFLVGETAAAEIEGAPVRSMARNVPVRANGGAGTVPLLAPVRSIRAVLRGGAFDVAHVQVPYSPLMAGRIIGQLDPGVALVGTYHVSIDGAASRVGARILGHLCRKSSRRFDRLVAVSETAARSAREVSGLKVDQIVPNMVDVARFRAIGPRRSRDDRRPHLVYLGALTARKAVRDLIGAAALLHPIFPRMRVTIAGKGPLLKSLRRRVGQLGLSGVVFLVGEIHERDKPALLQEADLACFPATHSESFGVVLLEAMAAGTPVLAANNPGFAEFLEPSQALFALGSSALARTARTVMEDAALRDQIHRRQQAIVTRYDIRSVAPEIARVYGMALRARACAPR
jgi:phosphatidyl-myo-inositol alpha-mannosyltransferase